MSDSQKKPNNLQIKITATESAGVLSFEGTTVIPNFARAKLATKDGITKFVNLSALKGSARRAAIRYGYEGVTYDEAAIQKKIAAKKVSIIKLNQIIPAN